MQLLSKFSTQLGRFILPVTIPDPSCSLPGRDRGGWESHIADHPGMIDHVYVTNTLNDDTPLASRRVVQTILESDMIVPRSWFSLYLYFAQYRDWKSGGRFWKPRQKSPMSAIS